MSRSDWLSYSSVVNRSQRASRGIKPLTLADSILGCNLTHAAAASLWLRHTHPQHSYPGLIAPRSLSVARFCDCSTSRTEWAPVYPKVPLCVGGAIVRVLVCTHSLHRHIWCKWAHSNGCACMQVPITPLGSFNYLSLGVTANIISCSRPLFCTRLCYQRVRRVKRVA